VRNPLQCAVLTNSEMILQGLLLKIRWETKNERSQYWGHYCHGIALLLYDCCLVYVRRFFASDASFSISLWDRDVFTADDFVGLVVAPLAPTPVTAASLVSTKGKPIHSKCQLQYSIASVSMPEPTRLEQVWAVTVHRATGVPKMDLASPCDCVAHVQTFMETAEEAQTEIQGRKKGHTGELDTANALLRQCARSTTIATNSSNPVWEETFELATIKREGLAPFLAALLQACGTPCVPPVHRLPMPTSFLPETIKAHGPGAICRWRWWFKTLRCHY
jgi:hypothetical protein